MISDKMTARVAGGTGESHVTKRLAEVSPRLMARRAVVLYLLEGTAAVFGQYCVQGKCGVSGNAAATSANILGHER